MCVCNACRISDVKGADEAKSELEDVVEFLRNPKKFQRLGGKARAAPRALARPYALVDLERCTIDGSAWHGEDALGASRGGRGV